MKVMVAEVKLPCVQWYIALEIINALIQSKTVLMEEVETFVMLRNNIVKQIQTNEHLEEQG